MNVFFSVVIPTHNAKKTIKKTLKSVINQTFKNYEIVIVDDCSKDSTIEQVQSILEDAYVNYKIVKLKVNSYSACARNVGVKLSIGEYIAFLDDDDLWLSNKLEVQHDAIKKHNLDWCFPNFDIMDDNYVNQHLSFKRRSGYYDFEDFMSGGNPVNSSGVVLKRELLLTYPFKDLLAEDLYTWLGISFHSYKGYLIEDVLNRVMIRNNSRSSNRIKLFINEITIKVYYGLLNNLGSYYFFVIQPVNFGSRIVKKFNRILLNKINR